MTEPTRERVAALIDEVFLFKSLDEETRETLKQAAIPRSYAPGELLIREDEEGLELLIIESGTVEVSQLMSRGDVQLAQLGPGAIVGEVAVITETPRTSTVKAVEDVVAVAIMAETVREIIAANPKLEGLLFRMIEGRARQTISMIPEEP